MSSRHFSLLAGSALLAVSTASAVNVRVTIENLAPSTPTGLYFTPVWTGFHSGDFDLFEVGSAASSQLETLAEVGDPGSLNTLFGSASGRVSAITANPTGPGGVIFSPGASLTFDLVLDPTDNRFLSFASMLVPTNDVFFAADGVEIFDAMGDLVGGTWTFAGTDSFDAGTELTDFTSTGGAAFLAGAMGGEGAVEGGVVTLSTGSAISDLGGLMTGAGTTIGTTSGTIFSLSVTAVPEPSAMGFLLGLGALATIVRRRR
jgi:hypothetical protein